MKAHSLISFVSFVIISFSSFLYGAELVDISDSVSSKSERTITLVTGNEGKRREIIAVVGNEIRMEHCDIDLPEIQGTSLEVAINKAKYAYEELKRPVLIEDSSYGFVAMGGLPGPYIKWFIEGIKTDGILKMGSGFGDNRVIGSTLLVYYDSSLSEPVVFEGTVEGTAPETPRGKFGFGWDDIFIPNGHTETYAEMSPEFKNTISQRRIAIDGFMNYIKNNLQ